MSGRESPQHLQRPCCTANIAPFSSAVIPCRNLSRSCALARLATYLLRSCSARRDRLSSSTLSSHGPAACCQPTKNLIASESIPRLIEDSGEIPCVFRFGGFCSGHDSWWIPHRRRSRQSRRVGARWLGGVAGDAAGQRLGGVGRWMELSGSRRCVVDGRRHDPWLAQTV